MNATDNSALAQIQTGHAAAANCYSFPSGNNSAPVAQSVTGRQAGVRGVTHPSVSDSDQNSAIRHQGCVVGRIVNEGTVAAVVRIKVGRQTSIIAGYYYTAGSLHARGTLIEHFYYDGFVMFVKRVGLYGEAKGGGSGGGACRKDERPRCGGGIVRDSSFFCGIFGCTGFHISGETDS